jgi:hypothetical protein
MSDNTNETIEMTSETIAGDLIGALVMELKLMPDIWPRIGPNEQDEIIERIRKRVTDNVRQAVHLIASDGRVTVVGDLKKVLFSDKVEALFSLGKNDPSAIELTRCTGQACLIVVASAGNHMGGADDLKAERQTTLISGEDDAANKIIEQARRRSRDKDEGDTPQTDA